MTKRQLFLCCTHNWTLRHKRNLALRVQIYDSFQAPKILIETVAAPISRSLLTVFSPFPNLNSHRMQRGVRPISPRILLPKKIIMIASQIETGGQPILTLSHPSLHPSGNHLQALKKYRVFFQFYDHWMEVAYYLLPYKYHKACPWDSPPRFF